LHLTFLQACGLRYQSRVFGHALRIGFILGAANYPMKINGLDYAQ
jgi:hypothetical protein